MLRLSSRIAVARHGGEIDAFRLGLFGDQLVNFGQLETAVRKSAREAA